MNRTPAMLEKQALIMGGSRESATYRHLAERSARLAHLLHARGLRVGDHLAVLMENNARYLETCWAGLQSGLYVTPVNWHLKPAEIGYVVQDCAATALVTSHALASTVTQLEPYLVAVKTRLVVSGGLDGWEDYEGAAAGFPSEPVEDETEGSLMFYSSGTTGRPKGIKRSLTGHRFGSASGGLVDRLRNRYGFNPSSVYLCPAPLYHAAPLSWSMAVQRIGGTVIVMEQFDPTWALELIEEHRVTHAQFVPTHFVRMLKLDPAEGLDRDLSSLKVVVHAAAPCPIEVKERMIDWFGPIIHEYYAGSEAIGTCAIGPMEWPLHKGSVGRPLDGAVHILDEEGVEKACGETGYVWFEGTGAFEYHNDPAKTASVVNDRGWSTLGDIGHVDDAGYLYLTDRASNMIISGGVNIYPQEIEDLLVSHPDVADVAVIGVPDPEMGEQVKAVVQPAQPSDAGAALADLLLAYCRANIAHYKCPRSIDFVDSLPRLPTGKLLKRELRIRYWDSADG